MAWGGMPGIKKCGDLVKWTYEEHEYMLDLVKKHGTRWKYIAQLMTQKFGKRFRAEQCRARFRMYPEKEWPIEYKETVEILPDGSHKSDKLLRMTAEQAKDPEYLLKAHGFDLEGWELVSARNNIWNVYSKQDGVQTLYSSKITVKPRTDSISKETIKKSINELLKDYKCPVYQPVRYSKAGKLLEVNVSDLHLNKLGYKDGIYDHKQAEEIFFFILNDVLTKTEGFKFEKILFIWSHDFFNIDGFDKATTKGTPQDTTIRYTDMFKQGKKMLIQAIDLLRQFAPVQTIHVGANHDRLTSYAVSEVLEAWFRNDPNVNIDTDPLSRKYIRYGNNLIGFSHGDKEKKRLGKIMPAEARQEWGKTLFAEIHAAHLHSEQAVKEENGVIVRYLSSPSGADNFHVESGYVGAVRKVQHFIWDRENGLEQIINTTIVPKSEELGTVYCL
jgi:Myb-like DNA-binding domain.